MNSSQNSTGGGKRRRSVWARRLNILGIVLIFGALVVVSMRSFVVESLRLMNVYIEFLRKTENIKIKELPLLFWEEDEKEWRKYKNKMLKRKILTALGLGKKKWKVQDA